MNSSQTRRTGRSVWRRSVWLLLLPIIPSHLGIPISQAATNVVIWDAGRRFGDTIEVPDRTGWRPVPSETLAMEKDPLKAASDPGYYGREYSFVGDAIIENPKVLAVFSAATGRMVLYAKGQEINSGAKGGSGRKAIGEPLLEVQLLPTQCPSGQISGYEILRNSGDEAVLKISYSGPGVDHGSARFSFGRDEIIEIKPADDLKGLSLAGSIDYGMVPAFVGDDLILDPSRHASAEAMAIPAENVFVGLMTGENHQVVMTWPKGKQQLRLRVGKEAQAKRRFEAIDFNHDGESFYLAILSAPGIWHREVLKPGYLEKDVTLAWKRPFPARWKTQLIEAGVPTTFGFRAHKGTVWRGVPGSYDYPVWFDGENAIYHLSKKVPPKGESIVYFAEGQDTPPGVLTPVEVMKATLGRTACESILDITGRKLRTHHRRGGEGVHRACTCGCTEAIQAVFETGEEVTKKAYVKDALEDMNFFVERHVQRIDEYTRFAASLTQFLQAKAAAAPELKDFCDGVEQVVQQIPQEYIGQKENMKSLEHASDLTRQTMALTETKRTNNLASYMKLLDAWRAMGGAQDYVLAQCHTITRKVFQQAGTSCLSDPRAVAVAQEVRARCRQVLRNPDGYEIWADY